MHEYERCSDPIHVTEVSVAERYRAFRELNATRAVLEMEFFLSKESATRAEIVTRKRYSKAIAVNGRSPEALVKGWNDGLSEILAALVSDLRATKF